MSLKDSFSLKYGSPLYSLFDVDTASYKKPKTPISVKNNYSKPLLYIFIAILIGLLIWFLIYSLTNKDKDEENI